MVVNTSKIKRMGYISNLNPQPRQKTHSLKGPFIKLLAGFICLDLTKKNWNGRQLK